MNSNELILNEVLSPATIDLKMEVHTKEEAIEKLAEMLLKEKRITEKEAFIEDITNREEIESTNMGMGVAIPHGKSTAVLKNSIAIGRLTEPMVWDSNDEDPVSVIFLLAVRDDAERDKAHLELISKLATLLLKKKFLYTLFKTKSKIELIDQMNALIGED